MDLAKPQFITELDVRVPFGKAGKYELLSPLVYITHVGAEPRAIEVPAKFITDFASIPRVVRWLISGHGVDRHAAVLHDYLYSIGFNRKLADAIFLEALDVSEVTWVKRQAMHKAVRLAGWAFHK